MLSQEYNQLFISYLNHFYAKYLNKMWSRKEAAIQDEFNLFYPVIGKDFHKEKNILLVGQATNGWDNKFKVVDIFEKDHSKMVNEAANFSQEDGSKCPLEWINEDWTKYSLYRSFFWNIIYKVVKSFYSKTDDNWNNIIAWSNIMKIAPAQGGNPDDLLIECQIEQSALIFKKEIEDLDPKNVVLMTNLKTWAQPVLELLKVEYEIVDGSFVEAIAYINNSKIIITRRGYFKVTHEEAVQELSSYLIK